MRIFACEYLTGGGLSGRLLSTGLIREGDIMLRSLVRDLADIPGVQVVTARDRRLREHQRDSESDHTCNRYDRAFDRRSRR